jgi:hypothetical protein
MSCTLYPKKSQGLEERQKEHGPNTKSADVITTVTCLGNAKTG